MLIHSKTNFVESLCKGLLPDVTNVTSVKINCTRDKADYLMSINYSYYNDVKIDDIQTAEKVITSKDVRFIMDFAKLFGVERFITLDVVVEAGEIVRLLVLQEVHGDPNLDFSELFTKYAKDIQVET